MPKLIMIPVANLAVLATYPGNARISPDGTNLSVIIGDMFYVLEGDFDGPQSPETLNDKIMQYLS